MDQGHDMGAAEMSDDHHNCSPNTGRYADYQAGPAITSCEEDEHGFFWAGNGEYETMVDFCPFCGTKAERPAVDQDAWEKIMKEQCEIPPSS